MGWDTGNPGDSSVVSAFPANERAQRSFVEAAFAVDHDAEEGATKGRHLKATFQAGADDPVPIAGYGIAYAKDVGGLVNMFFIDPSGVVTQITDGPYTRGPVKLPATSEALPAALTHGYITARLFNGKPELYWVDGEGNELRMTFEGATNVSFPEDALEFLAAFTTMQMEAAQFRGDPITLEIDGSGDVECDLSLGLNYYLEMDQNVGTFSFTNAPELRVPNILVKIKNLGAFDITTFAFTAAGGVVEVPDAFVGSLSPTHSKTTDYGLSLFPGPVLSIYPVLMKVYVP